MLRTRGVITEGLSRDQIKDWYEARVTHDVNALASLLGHSIDFEDVASGYGFSEIPQFLEHLRRFYGAFSDSSLKVNRVLMSGKPADLIIVEYSFEGVHRGKYENFEISGKKTRFRLCDILRVENQKITECRTYTDRYKPLSDLGLITLKATASGAKEVA